MNTNALVPVRDDLMFLPVMDMEVAIARRNHVVDFVKRIMKDGTDFGKIPGAGDKPTLLKPGAEKLATFFGLTPVFVPIAVIEDWTGDEHKGESFFYYRYRCELHRNGNLIASSEGSCNSWESKYRYRKAERVCPSCGQAAIIKGKAEYGGGYVCFGKKGGCGAKFKEGDAAIESQEVGRIANPDVADQVNTIQKMAQKRSLIASVLLAVNASEFFTQDIEDMVIDAVWEPVTEPITEPVQAKPQAKQPQGHKADVDFERGSAQNGSRTAQTAQERTEGNNTPSEATEPTRHADLIDKLTGDCLARANRARQLHAQSRGPASTEQYRFLAGTIDDIVQVAKAHNAILEVFVGRAVNIDNPPGIGLASKMLNALLEERTVERDGEKVKEPNPDYDPGAVNCVRVVYNLVREANGQVSLFDDPQANGAKQAA